MELVSQVCEKQGLTAWVDIARGLSLDLDNLQRCTLFVPTNQAFAQFRGTDIQTVALNHIVPKKLFARELQNDMHLQAKSKKELFLNVYEDSVFMSTQQTVSRVVQADIEAYGNNVIHVIDKVLQ